MCVCVRVCEWVCARNEDGRENEFCVIFSVPEVVYSLCTFVYDLFILASFFKRLIRFFVPIFIFSLSSTRTRRVSSAMLPP